MPCFWFIIPKSVLVEPCLRILPLALKPDGAERHVRGLGSGFTHLLGPIIALRCRLPEYPQRPPCVMIRRPEKRPLRRQHLFRSAEMVVDDIGQRAVPTTSPAGGTSGGSKNQSTARPFTTSGQTGRSVCIGKIRAARSGQFIQRSASPAWLQCSLRRSRSGKLSALGLALSLRRQETLCRLYCPISGSKKGPA